MVASIPHSGDGAARPDDMWIISRGRFTDMDVNRFGVEATPASPMVYCISDLGRYLLSPDPIEVLKTLVGCDIRYYTPIVPQVKEKIRNRLPAWIRRSARRKDIQSSEVLMAPPRKSAPHLEDAALKAHFRKIEGFLTPYAPIAKRLRGLDLSKVADIVGICEDLANERSLLKLEGAIEEKVDYVVKNINQEVAVILGGAYIADDLFEMRGFDFRAFDPKRSHRLIRFIQDGKVKACVLDANDDVQFWIADVKRIRYLQLLEQSIERNPELRNAFLKCTEGHARPFRLFFNRKMEIDYSHADPPQIYREVFESCRLGTDEKDAVISSLSSHQIGVSFSYVPGMESGECRVYICLSVMHNVRALEPIKTDLPQLYSEISKRASMCESGRFYLLDSAAGYQNAQ
ncbi:MAG: hypothetical protein K9N21_09730 [Deltaproteobacteria bacterium]|nr:hypothetical protein [Deltaproteobacteria bacterium]